jgi:hypothetical protein
MSLVLFVLTSICLSLGFSLSASNGSSIALFGCGCVTKHVGALTVGIKILPEEGPIAKENQKTPKNKKSKLDRA